jgi:hypothetical protein
MQQPATRPARRGRRGLAGSLPRLAGQLEIGGFDLLTVSPNTRRRTFASEAGQTKETTMFSLSDITRSTQQYVCMALAALIVTASLSLGAYAAEAAAHADYTVTITQLA